MQYRRQSLHSYNIFIDIVLCVNIYLWITYAMISNLRLIFISIIITSHTKETLYFKQSVNQFLVIPQKTVLFYLIC